MIHFPQLIIDSLLYIALATFLLLALFWGKPRLMLQDYPPAIQALVPPKTEAEKRQGLLLGLPFLLVLLVVPFFFAYSLGETTFAGLFLHTFGVVWAFNLWDWLVLDWLVFCTLTPRQIVIPGSEGHPAYKDYGFHFHGFLIGTGFSLGMALVVATLVYLVR
jgi:hypothetical protein